MKKVIYSSIALAMLLPFVSYAEESTTTTSVQSGSVVQPIAKADPMRAFQFGMGKLSEADKATLTTLIRDFLKSKGIELPAEVKAARKEIKEMRKETHTEIKEMRKNTQDEVKALRAKTQAEAKTKREEMRGKIKDKRGGMYNGSGMTMSGTIAQ